MDLTTTLADLRETRDWLREQVNCSDVGDIDQLCDSIALERRHDAVDAAIRLLEKTT